MVSRGGAMVLIDPNFRKILSVYFLVVLLFLGTVNVAAAQTALTSTRNQESGSVEPAKGAETPRIQIVRTDTPPDIDGDLNDAVWADAAVIDTLIQVEPVEGANPSERTEIRILYDADHLYFAIKCFDRNPEDIIANQMKRDGDIGADDHIQIALDPFLDRRNGFLFEMNAVGARGDALLEDNRNFRFNWDGVWRGKSKITPEGWQCEMAIPFKTISFNPNTTTWGLNITRIIRRRNEVVRWSAARRNLSMANLANAGDMEGIENIRQGIGLDFKPYLVLSRLHDGANNNESMDFDGGFDLFYKITPSLTGGITVNTDFAATEVDDRQINLSRFPLFFPEKRDFFLQDAGIFRFGDIFFNPLPFQSRRIGLGPGGEVRDILAGGRLTGRVGDWNIGLLDVQMKDDAVLGSKNLAVGRFSMNVQEESSIGGIFTSGDPGTTGDNSIFGFDYLYRNSHFNGDKVLTGSVFFLQSHSTPDNAGGGIDGDDESFGFKLNYPNDIVQWNIGASEIGEKYRAALGFVPRPGIREYFGGWRYRWRPPAVGADIRRIDSGFRTQFTTNLQNDIESANWNFNLLQVEWESGDFAFINLTHDREVLTDPFPISSGVTIPVGDYRFTRAEIGATSSPNRPFNVGGSIRAGDFFDGTRQDYSIQFGWRPSSNFSTSFEIEQNQIDLPAGKFINRLARLRLNVFFTPDLSWTTFVQYDNVSETAGINSRLRWIITPGNEFFFVLNQGYDATSSRISPTFTEFTTKAGWTIRF